jgi:hypothetical protein
MRFDPFGYIKISELEAELMAYQDELDDTLIMLEAYKKGYETLRDCVNKIVKEYNI